MKKYQAASYMRISVSDDRALESDSILSQQSIIQTFAKNSDDIEIISEHIDDGHSGLVFDRPAFSKMIEEVFAGKINCIIVKDLSRFGRDYIETGRYLSNILPSCGVRFIAITDLVDTNKRKAQDDVLLQIKTLINDEFSRGISVRTRTALKAMCQSGLYIGASPIYGYRRSKDDKHKLSIDEYSSVIVKEIFNMKIEGFTAKYIADYLNEKCILSPKSYKQKANESDNGNWIFSTVFRILKDEIYTGILVQRKHYTLNYKLKKRFVRPKEEWIRIPNSHEPVISKIDYDTVQRIIGSDTRVLSNQNKVSIFSGLIFCGSCGGNMTIKTVYSDKTSYRYYYCPTKKVKGCNSSVYIKENEMYQLVFSEIKMYLTQVVEYVAKIDKLSQDNITKLLTKNQTDLIIEKQSELSRKFQYRSSLYQSLIERVITQDELNDMKSRYSKEIEELEDIIEKKIGEVSTTIGNVVEIISRLNLFCSYKDLVSFNRGKIVRMVKKIVVDEVRGIKVEFLLM